MGLARRKISLAKLRKRIQRERQENLAPAQSYAERRWLLDRFYKLRSSFNTLEERDRLLPCLVDLLKPHIEVRIACLLEQRDELCTSSWHASPVPISEVKQARAYAESQLRYLIEPTREQEILEWPHSQQGMLVVLPMVASQSTVFGVLCLQCPKLDEAGVTLLHALGNHIALALDHQHQVAAQKKSEEKVKLLQAEIEKVTQFRKLAESLPQMVWRLNDQGKVVYTNRRLIQYTGQDIEGAHFQKWLELCHPDERQTLLKAWNRAIIGQEIIEVENRLRRADGAYRWHTSRVVPERDESGRIQGWVGTFTDIDEKRRAREQVERINRRVTLLSGIAAELLQLTTSQIIVERALARLSEEIPFDAFLNLLTEPRSRGLKLAAFGGIPGEGLSRFQDLHSEGDTGHEEALAQPCMEVFQSLGMESCASFPLKSQARLVGFLVFGCRQQFSQADMEFMRTVCDQIAIALDRAQHEEAMALTMQDLEKARIEADSANETKSLFLANMSHEIRTPIGVIMGFSDLASSAGYSEEERRGALQTIKRNAEQLSQLVDDILDLTKVESGHLEIESTSVEWEDLLKQLTSLLNFKASEKGIKLTIEASPNLPPRMMTDPLRLRQCLINVIGNAIKFTQEGGVHVHISLERDAGQRRMLKFVVTDTGIGLSKDQQEKLFRSFSQANAATTRKFGGTGLGLCLARNLARAMGGDLYLERSVPGEGSTFVLTVGISVLPNRLPTYPEACGTSTLIPPHLHGLRVLLVEDSPDNQILIKRYLERAGVEVAIASDGNEGMEKALQGAHDLVLMDIQMPFVDGYEATSRLRRSGFKKPVIALTANAMRGDRERSIQAGFTDHLSKPVNIGALLNAVSYAVRRLDG